MLVRCLVMFLMMTLVSCQCPHQDIFTKISDKSSWPLGFSLSMINKRNFSLTFPLLIDIDLISDGIRVAGITIGVEGRLVFSPMVSKSSIAADWIQIGDGGSLEIGSENCPFDGEAEILLTGKKGNYASLDGEKFISVHAGGRLEIHGKPKRSWSRLANTAHKGRNIGYITMVDDVSSWENGDKLVMASTDFDMNQAEEITVEMCQGNKCKVKGALKWTHFGEEEAGMSMRGEVGLLTRNILIQGEMENTCYGDQQCRLFNFDTFGGHIIARKGFTSFKVENVELTHMGQQGITGRYPLHWHMAGYLTPGDSYVRNNSIHHTFQRCVTCHGSMGCRIEDNVGYESLGHCYFLEDGVEKGTMLIGNLGINTRKASQIPSDANPATFWITHPQTYLEGNTAAGSEGVGFWFLQAVLPTGESGRLQQAGLKHYFEEDELFHTPIYTIIGNTAHSAEFGFFFDSILEPDQDASDRNQGKFSPRIDPTNSRSEKVWTQMEDLTCYKTTKNCLWMHLDRGNYTGIKIADSREGMFVHEESRIGESLFIGESEQNFGQPNKKVGGKFWHRSLPGGKANIGFRNYVNPVLLENSVFRGFKDSPARYLRAIVVKNLGPKSLYTGVKNITFVDTEFNARFGVAKNDEEQVIYHNWDRSLTDVPGQSYIVSKHPHLISSSCSTNLPLLWGHQNHLVVCPHKYISLNIPKDIAHEFVLTRLDTLSTSFSPMMNERRMYMRADRYHLISYTGNSIPKKNNNRISVTIKIAGIDKNVNTIVGFCLPVGSTFKSPGNQKVNSMETLRSDNSGTGFFHDSQDGVVFFHLVGIYQRPVGDVTPCGIDNSACVRKKMVFQSMGDKLEMDCRQRNGLLSKYQESVV